MQTVREQNMFSPGESVLAAVSGGADSMCMLSLLAAFRETLGFRLQAVHVNHGIRGEEADRDQRFVEAYCKQNGIPLSVIAVNVPKEAEKTGESTEVCARRLRYEVFDTFGADKIATAHTASDAAETLLLNLSRGAGLNGLCSIPPARGNVVRPLFSFFRCDTEQYCRKEGINYVTDSTNETDFCIRNRIRRHVIPALRAENPAFEQNVQRCIGLLREDEACLSSLADRLFDQAFDPAGGFLSAEVLAAAPYALRSRAIRKYLRDILFIRDVAQKHIALLDVHLSDDAYVLELPGDIPVSICGGTLSLRKEMNGAAPVMQVLRAGAGVYTFGKYRIGLSLIRRDDFDKAKFTGIVVDFSKIDAIIFLRSRNPGDRLTMASRGCSKTLKKLYNERKIPLPERNGLPVLADSHGLIYAAVGGADAARLPDRNTKEILLIECEQFREE